MDVEDGDSCEGSGDDSSEDSSGDSGDDSVSHGNDESKSELNNDESSTSPIKVASCSQDSDLNDSGIGSPESKAVSSKKVSLNFDIENIL